MLVELLVRDVQLSEGCRTNPPPPSSQTLKTLPRWMGGRVCFLSQVLSEYKVFLFGLQKKNPMRSSVETPPTTNQRSEKLGPSEVSKAAPPPPTAAKHDEASVSRPYTP